MFDSCCKPSMDVKNRFFVPTEYRDELGTNVVLLPSPDVRDKCVFIYNRDEWDVVLARYKKTMPNDRKGKEEIRRVISSVVHMEVDKFGRLTLKAELKAFAEITGKDIVVIGNENHLEIWSPENWLPYENGESEFDYDQYDIRF